MLNYGYAILASEITKEILHQKLDPYIGIIHADLNKKTSLTYDMIEEYRQQIIDKTVLTLINTKQVNEEDIDKRTNTINQETKKLLTENIMKKLHTEITYNNQQITYIQIIEKQIQQLKNTITNNTKYKGFYLRW